jgi:glucans biosynthesis protein
MKRRLVILCALAVAAGAAARGADALFDFEVLRFRAKALAVQPYQAPKSRVPDWLRQLSYDEYRLIQFDARLSWWRAEELPFQLQFFHPGGSASRTVQISELVNKVARPIAFSPKFYDYDTVKRGWRVPADLGFAGFKVLHPVNQPGRWDEVVSFLGASYFRALGRDQHYGLSARGLAVNPGEPGGEEFPVFEEFWIERPLIGGTSVTIYALLNSPSATGAYRFVLTPGVDTVMRVRAAVYFRRNPQVPGLAPLTSMFAHGENTGWSRQDFRPEVHDSDGLLIETGAGEWVWRPLDNPKTLRMLSFSDSSPRGYGLMQRDRDFEHYGDLEARYHQRPSAWVEPVGRWGPGAVRLMELPTADEFSDNIVAFWAPAQLPPAGEPVEFEYNLHWLGKPGPRPPAGLVTSTRTAAVPGRPELRRFVIEFAGAYLNSQPEDPAIEAILTFGAGGQQAGRTVVQKNRFSGAWRVVFEIRSNPGDAPVELRCFLRKGQHVLTETWSYLWNP